MTCEDFLEVCFLGLVSGRKDLCMVPCHSCYIYGWGDAQKSSIGGGDASHKREALFIGKASSHCVILLYCETL